MLVHRGMAVLFLPEFRVLLGLRIQLYTCKRPFHALDEREVSEVVVNGQRPERPSDPIMTDSVWALVQSCWAQQVSERPTVSSVVSKMEEITSVR